MSEYKILKDTSGYVIMFDGSNGWEQIGKGSRDACMDAMHRHRQKIFAASGVGSRKLKTSSLVKENERRKYIKGAGERKPQASKDAIMITRWDVIKYKNKLTN